MLLKCIQSDGVFQKEYRKQLLAAISVTLITFSHGIILGWMSPMLIKLQSVELTPLSFDITLEQASWVGSTVTIGGLTGNIILALLLDRLGRKICLYCLAVPQVCAWILIYFAHSVEYLYVSRMCAGFTGGGSYVVLPIFLAEISDCKIRGRLTSLFPLSLSTGILIGYILAAHLDYFIIPCICMVLPILYFILVSYLPETPQYLIHVAKEDNAVAALRFYKNSAKLMTKNELQKFDAEFKELQAAVLMKQTTGNAKVALSDYFTKKSLSALGSGFILIFVNVFSGTFALIFYMSSIFAAAKVELHPDTNTIIIGVIQIIGTYTATILVDRFGRKILMIISTAGMGIGLALFGLYGFVAEETTYDLSDFNQWLPLVVMSVAVFSANIGIQSVTFVLLLEIMPAKIRSRAASFCLAFMSIFGFFSVKTFPIFMAVFGLAATMWLCASVCAFGLFYVTIFIQETKGKSLNTVEKD